jgi:hypothetical protein
MKKTAVVLILPSQVAGTIYEGGSNENSQSEKVGRSMKSLL